MIKVYIRDLQLRSNFKNKLSHNKLKIIPKISQFIDYWLVDSKHEPYLKGSNFNITYC